MGKGIVWITGASSGIGKSLAIEFIKQNESVAVSARRETFLKKISDELSGRNDFSIYPVDVSDYKALSKTHEIISKQFQIDCLINNAGVTTFMKVIDDKIENINKIISVNLLGAINAIKLVLPRMIERKQGTIINIVSVAANKIFTESSSYSASKAGLLAYTNVLREEVREFNIRVINILPGATKTPIWPGTELEKHSNRMMSPNDIAKIVHQIYSNKNTAVYEEVTLRPLKGDL